MSECDDWGWGFLRAGDWGWDWEFWDVVADWRWSWFGLFLVLVGLLFPAVAFSAWGWAG